MAISWKWTHHAQKVLSRQIWVLSSAFLALTVCVIDFGNLISLNPSRSGFCSSRQCYRTQLVLQLCQLHHLLTRFGLEVNHRRSCSISWWSRCLIQSRARRRGRPVTGHRWHMAPVHHFWPRSLAPSACKASTATPRTQWTRPLSPSSRSLARKAAAVSSPSRAHSGELNRARRCIAAHQNSPTAPPWTALHPPPTNSPWNPPVSRHFQHSPNRVAVTFFSGELNAELLGASRLLWLGPRGSLGP